MSARPTTVVKLGGAVLEDAVLPQLVSAIAERSRTEAVVVVHGGGRQSTELARRLGHEPRMVHGRRVTGEIDLDVALWVMRGEVNARLVSAAHQAGIRAAGMSGIDAGTVRVEKRPPWIVDGEVIDFGHVGDVVSVDPSLLQTLLDSGTMPILASLGIDGSGGIFNVNADTVAIHVARALLAERLFFVAEAGGLRRSAADPSTHMSRCARADFEEGTTDGWISDGMRVKLQTGFEALDAGVREVYVVAPGGLVRPEAGTRLVPDSRAVDEDR